MDEKNPKLTVTDHYRPHKGTVRAVDRKVWENGLMGKGTVSNLDELSVVELNGQNRLKKSSLLLENID